MACRRHTPIEWTKVQAQASKTNLWRTTLYRLNGGVLHKPDSYITEGSFNGQHFSCFKQVLCKSLYNNSKIQASICHGFYAGASTAL